MLLIKYPSQITATSAILVDLIDSNNQANKAHAHILLKDMISDYLPIILLISDNLQKLTQPNQYIRDTKNLKLEQFL